MRANSAPRARTFASSRLHKALLCSSAFFAVLMASGAFFPAYAQSAEELAGLRAEIERQSVQLDAQQRALDEQRQTLMRQMQRLERIAGIDLAATDGRGLDPILVPSDELSQSEGGQQRAEGNTLAALPEFASVLTPRGNFVVEPSLEFTHSSANRLVFRGVEIVTGLQIGVIEASDADRNAIVATAAARYGLTERLELELRIPYVYRDDTVTTLAQRDEAITRSISLSGSGIGDVEASARYQFNTARPGGAIFIGNLRIKSDTGTSPWEIDRDEFGVLEELATGSGFWGVEPGLTMLYPSDPVVLFANVSYLYHAPADIDRIIGDVFVGEVDPGDSIGAGVGFGFALNPNFSFSLGYKHNYILETEAEFGETTQRSEPLHVGSLLLGMSYRFSDSRAANLSFDFGVTSDAPDVRMVLRMPLTL